MSQEIRETQEHHDPQNDAASSSSDQKEPKPPSWIIDINQRLSKRNENPTNVVNDAEEVGCKFDKYPARRLNQIQEDAFRPYIASIGSFFPEKSEMDEHKERLLVRLLAGRDDKKKKQIKLEDLVNAMKLLVDKTRACYSDSFFNASRQDRAFGHPYKLGDNALVRWMVLDGCFVIEVLRSVYWQFTHAKRMIQQDPFFLSSSTIQKLGHDFLVFGNQLPFFVLKELYSLTSSADDDNTPEPPLRCLAIYFFRVFAESASVTLLEDDPRADECHHLLHLFSYACSNKSERCLSIQENTMGRLRKDSISFRGRKLTYNAKELQEAGVKIKPPKHRKDHGLMSISTTKGPTLRIQPFYLDNNVVSTLLNFLAHEEFHTESSPYFTNYILFLDCLIDSEADVEILHKAGILNHAFGNNRDVVNIIYEVARELKDPEYNHLGGEITELNRFCKDYYGSKSRTWWRNLINNYFTSPWTIMSLVAATILLVLTFVQTFYTTYAYYKPPN